MSDQPNWGAPTPPTPKKKHPVRNTLLGLVGAFVLLIVLVSACVAAVSGEDAAQTPTKPEKSTGQEQPQDPRDKDYEDVQKEQEASERANLKVLDLNVTTEYGVTDARLNYEITNDSSKVSDYDIEYEIVDKNTGKRIWDGWIYETNVKPGQTATGEDFPVVKDGTPAERYEVNVISFDRTESW